MRKQDGFTLIELLIVLAILGILVGIVAMSVGDLTTTANERGMESEADIVQTAIDTYRTQDVLVGLAEDITTTTTFVQINKDDEAAFPFAKYLKTSTKYYYAWEYVTSTVSVSSTTGLLQ